MNEILFAAGPLPSPDPIPLPAPVWLFRVLHDLTLTLHFSALSLFLGGLALATFLNWRGHRVANRGWIEASHAIAGWLPVLMTYVINLGIPPLLFAQVLYGRALYTSSVLIGPYWIAVIPLLIGCYHLLYVMKARAEQRQPFVGPAMGSLVTAWIIARIYTANMSLMIETDHWAEAYKTNAFGSSFISGHGAWFRWGYMLSAGLTGAGVLIGWLSQSQRLSQAARDTLITSRIRLVLPGAFLGVVMGILAWAAQPLDARTTCSAGNTLWLIASAVWFIGLAGTVLASLFTGSGRAWPPLIALSTAWFIQTAGFVECRALVRDAALAIVGFDVTDRAVVVNWSVLLLFLGLFVAGLGVIAWLARIAYRSSPQSETVS
ncbi:MAG: hypothetical protein U0798_17320 [Gemmataceae bacterium]